MAAVDDIYNQITSNSRKRTGRSFFPAANGSAQGQTIGFSGAGIGGFRALPPDQNPAYQAALARNYTTTSMRAGGSGAGAYSWITTPSGGQMRVPTGSLGALLQKGTSLEGSQVTQFGNQAPFNAAASYAKGYGAPTPSVQNLPGGPVLVQGGVANPVSNLTPAQRIQYGQGGVLDYLRSGPTSLALQNLAGGFGRNIASWFGGGNAPSVPPSASATKSYEPTNEQVGFGQVIPGALGGPASGVSNTMGTMANTTPRRYSDYGYY